MASPISLDRDSTAAPASWNAVAPSRTAITARMTIGTEQSPLARHATAASAFVGNYSAKKRLYQFRGLNSCC